MMKCIPCLLCGHLTYDLWGCVVKDYSANHQPLHRRFVRCSRCGLVYANPQADTDEFERYYNSTYYNQSDVSFMHQRPYKTFLKRRLKTLTAFKRHGSILEIGCGIGSTLAYFQSHGFSVIGVEPGDCQEEQQKHFPTVPIINGAFPHTELKGTQYDIVYMWHVIEHVPDPILFLRQIAKHLKQDGLLLLGTENIGLSCRLDRLLNSWAGKPPGIGTSPEHTFFPTRYALTKMLQNAGFSVVRYRIYDDNVKGHPLRPDIFFYRSFKNMLHPVNQFRWIMRAFFYSFTNLMNTGGPKCEIVATKS